MLRGDVKKGDTVTVSTKKKKETDGKTTEKISLTAKQKTEEIDVGLDICDVSMIYSSAKCGKLSSRN